MAIDVYFKLDDIGLFKKPRKHEVMSQYQRAVNIQQQFAHCMLHVRQNSCCMPDLCAHGIRILCCAHLHVDYSNFTGHGIPLTKHAAKKIDERLRAIGTLVYRDVTGVKNSLPGDIHVPSLTRISSFPGQRKGGGKRAATAKQSAPKQKGFLAWFFG